MNNIIDKVSLTDVFTNDLSREVFETKYKYQDETVFDTMNRVSAFVASCEATEEKRAYWQQQFNWMLSNFKFIPGGRIMSNAGLSFRGTTLINCYVSGFQGRDKDSMESIFDELRRQGLILKSEGGYGFCVDVLRPRYSYITGIGSESPGAVTMLEMWDTQSKVITEGSGMKSSNKNAKSGIRKGAQMVTMSCFSDTTMILTSIGWLNVCDIIYRVQNCEIIYAVCENNEYHQIYDQIVREPEPLYEIETEDGTILEVTADHEIEVYNINTKLIYLKKIKDIDMDVEYAKILS